MSGPVMAPRVFAAPKYSINLETTNYCVLNCFMCCQPLITKPRGFIDPDLVSKVVDDLARHFIPAETRIQLIGQGEPLLHPHFFELVRRVKSRGFLVDFVTNAVRLEAAQRRELLASAVDEVKLSFYGWDPASYRAIHGRDRFEPALANIIRLLAGPRPFRISLHLLRCRTSAAVVERLERLWSCFPVDVACTYQVRNLRDILPRRNPGSDEQRLPEHPRPVYSRMCFGQWPIIHWDGSVSPCVYDYDSQLTIGNVREDDYGELLRGPGLRAFVEAARAGRLRERYGFDPCARCSDADSMVGDAGEELPLPPPVVNNSATAGGRGGADFVARHFPEARADAWPTIFRELLFSPLSESGGARE